MQRRDDAGNFRACERIVDGLRITPRGHKSLAPKLSEMLREGRLAEANRLLQRRHGPLALMKVAQHHQAMPVGDRLQEGLCPVRALSESFKIHAC